MNQAPAQKTPLQTNPLADAKAVLETEIIALQQLQATLGESFVKATQILAACQGRVIVTGIGKSGHVARKITATMASTGTPAMFVHPAEASHGDMGMVTRNDVVLALSNSGEAAELGDILAYAKRFSIPLIAMTSRKNSMLGMAANCTLELPQAAEACPMGLAPTSSTTMMMALGDALAIALLNQHGFSSVDYKTFHPGGKLGKKLQLVKDLMHTGTAIPLGQPNMKMSDVILIMTEKTFGCCGILDSAQHLQGIITDGDVRRHMGDGLLNMQAKDVMTCNPQAILTNALAAEALGRMNEKKITSLFATDADGRVEGIVRMHDLLRAGVG